MPIKTYKTKDEVPAEQQDGAIELKDGSFLVDEPAGDDGKGAALDAERKQRKAAEALAKKTADELKKIQTEQAARDGGITSEKLAEIEKAVEARVLEKYAPDIEAGKKAQTEVRTLKLDAAIKAAAAKAGFKGDKLDDYWKLHGDEFDLTDDGKPMVKANPGTSIEKLIEGHKTKRPEWVEGTKATGSGAAGTTQSGVTQSISTEAILNNPGAALQAARAAGAKE